MNNDENAIENEIDEKQIQETRNNNDKDCLIDDENITDLWLKSKYKIIKNLLVIGFAWIFQFTAYQSMAILQSSLNSAKGLGTASLSTIYVALVLSSLLLPPILIRYSGLKWTIVMSQATYTLFIASNIYPQWYTSIPSAAILGLGAAPLWTAKCTYLTEVAGYYARLSKETTEAVVNRFFGIFFAMFQTSQIWGNVISSTILKQGLLNNTNSSINITFCGARDCPGGEGSKIKRPEEKTIYLLCGIYVASAIFAMVLISLFLDTYKRKDIDRKEVSAFSTMITTFKHMKNKYQLLIIPMTFWLGFEQGFLGADYTKSYVSCVKGVDFVGLTMISYGVVDALGSYLFGIIMKYTGRIFLICVGAILHYGIIITLLIWVPTPDQTYVIFLMPILWGVCDAIWQTQINSFYGVIFNDNQEAAFSNFRLWESMGFAIAYAYSNYLCVRVKLYLLVAYLTTAMLGYLTIEVLERIKKRSG